MYRARAGVPLKPLRAFWEACFRHLKSAISVAAMVCLYTHGSSGMAQEIVPLRLIPLEPSEIRGRVKDPAGKPIAGAVLTVRMIGTGWTRNYRANSRGWFQLTFLTGMNTYLVTCTAPNRVPKDLLLDVATEQLLMKDIELLTPEEFSAQNPSVPLAYGGMLEALGAIDAHNQGVALFNAGIFQDALPFLEAAGRQLEKALAQGLDPAVQTDFRARLGSIERLQGCALAEMGKMDPAKCSLLFAQSEPLLWKALEGNTSDTVVYLHLIEILKARKDTAALARIDNLYVNKSPVVPFNHGVEAFNEGQVETAARFFQSTLTLDPRFAEAHYLLARCEWELGRAEASRSHLLEYLKLSPEGENAKKARAMLSKTEVH